MSERLLRVLVPVTFPGGGIRTYMIYNLKPLHQAGFRFTFMSQKGSVFDNFKKDFADCEDTEFVDISPGTIGAVSAIRKELKTGRYSLIHSQGLQAGTLTEIARFIQRYTSISAEKISSIITLHDVIVPQNDIPGRFKWLKKKIISFFTKRANVIIPVSHDCAENHLAVFPAWKKGSVKIVPILNGVKINKLLAADFNPQSGGTSAAANKNENITFGFFGRFMPQKGFDILLESLKIIAEQYNSPLRRGVSEGDGVLETEQTAPPQAATLQRKGITLLATIDRHGYTRETLSRVENTPVLKQMVRFIESVPDITPLLQDIDVCIIPSRWEACPILPMEVIAAGIPVIGSDCIGLREVLAGTPAIQFSLACDFNHTLTDCIIELINNFAEHKQRATDYVNTARERFDVKKAAEELLTVYQELTSCK